jgi:peptidoglycan hydrolase-like protein with peptidoglycan-binding domain
MAFGFGDIISIGFRVISNKNEIMQVWNEIAPLIQQATKTYASVKNLVDRIAPGVLDQVASTVEPLTKGDDGSFSAYWLEESLNKILNTNLVVDGDIGEESRKAIRIFQEQEGLPVDGWAGAGTTARVLARLEAMSRAA